MAAQLVQIEKDGHRASVVESTLSVWVARGWKLVTESDSQAEGDRPEDGESDSQAEGDRPEDGESDSQAEGDRPEDGESGQVETVEVDAGQKFEGDKPETDKPAPIAPVAKPAGAHQAPEPSIRS